MAALIPAADADDSRSLPTQDPAAQDDPLAQMAPAPGTDAPLPGFAELDTTAFWAEVDRAAPPLLRLGLRVAVWVLTWLPIVLVGRLRTFPRLSAPEQDQLLCRAAASRWYLLRQLVTLLKALACFAYFREPAVRGRFGPNDAPPRPAAPTGAV